MLRCLPVLLAALVLLVTAHADAKESSGGLARVDSALRSLPAAGHAQRSLRRRARVRVEQQRSAPACPDAGGIVRGTERWSRTLAGKAGRDADAAEVRAALVWEGLVGDDARLRSWKHRLTVSVGLTGRSRGRAVAPRRFKVTLSRDGLVPRAASRARTTLRWTGRGANAKGVRASLAAIGAAARQDLERAAEAALLAAERRWYDDFACVQLAASPGAAQAAVGAATPVIVTAQAITGGPVVGTVALSEISRGTVDPASGLLPSGAPFVSAFTGTEAGTGGVTAIATSRRGRGRARWDVTLTKPTEQAPPEEEPWPGFTQVALSGVELDGTISHYKKELPGPDDTVTTEYKTNGTMKYRTSPETKDRNPGEKWWDWDFADHLAEFQVGRLEPVLYESHMSASIERWVEDDHAFWDCSYTLPDAGKPPALVGILSRRADGYEVFWSFMPAISKCPPGAPLFGFEALPSETLITRFKGGDVFNGEHHISKIPIDIDHRWTDGAGSHRLTWKGAVYASEPQI